MSTEPQSPVVETAPTVTSTPANETLGWSLVIIALIGALIGFAVMSKYGQPIALSKEMADIGPMSPPDQIALKNAATERMVLVNSITSFCLLATSVGVLLGAWAGTYHPSRVRIVVGAVVGLILTAAISAAAAYAGIQLKARLHPIPVGTLSLSAKTICVQMLAWGLTGMAFCSAIALAAGRAKALPKYAGAGLLGGILAGVVYPPLAAVLFQMDDTDQLVPLGTASGLVWGAVSTGLIAIVVVGLNQPAKKAAA